MKVLLDTHALWWMLQGNPRLSRRAMAAIDDRANEIMVSAVSGYEICLKYRLGKMAEAAPLVGAFEAEIARANCLSLPVTLEHAVVAGRLELHHRDPFDRMLIAQALVERVPLVSNETLFDTYGIERIW